MKATLSPGVFPGMNPAEYHAGAFPGAVSYSTLKLLLDEGGPAKYRAAVDGPRVEKPQFDLGTALHALVLGVDGERLVEIPHADYRTAAARDLRDAAYADGKTPLLSKQLAEAKAAADALPPHIRDYFTGGTPEVALLWEHPAGVLVRGQIDYLRPDMIVDLKSMSDTSTRSIQRAVWDYRYYLQAATYRRMYAELTGELLPYFIVGVELKPPYLARAVEISDDYLDLGAVHLDQAISTYLECRDSGEWPGHPAAPDLLLPPPWAWGDVADATITALEELIEGDTK